MERRSFFRSFLGTAVAGATVAAAKPSPGREPIYDPTLGADPNVRGTVKVTSYAGYQCAECGSAMWNSRNKTMRCSATECPNYDVPLRMPQFDAIKADSDEEELLRHSFIIMGLMLPGERVSLADMKLGSEVIKRFMVKMDANKSEHPYPGMCFPTLVHDIHPHDLARELGPYYQIS